MSGDDVSALPRPVLDDLAPAARRAVALDPHSLARMRADGETVTVLLRLPFDVLVSRSLRAATGPLDRTVRADEFLDWLDGERPDPPAARDPEWRAGIPPTRNWRRIETVPDDVLRARVRAGALALKDAAARDGVPGAQPRAEVADALLGSVVLTASDGEHTAEVTLRAVSALTRMGFLRRGGSAHVDVSGRWIRLAGEYGSVFLERQGAGLSLA